MGPSRLLFEVFVQDLGIGFAAFGSTAIFSAKLSTLLCVESQVLMYASNSSHTSSSCILPSFPTARLCRSVVTKRSSSPFWISLQLLCHVAFRSLISNPISYRTSVISFHFDLSQSLWATVLVSFDCVQWTVLPASTKRSLASF